MPVGVIVGAASVSGGVVSLWWTVAGDRRRSQRAAKNLRAGLYEVTDLRTRALQAPASERAVLPLMARAAALARRLTPAGAVDKLNHRIARAGMSSTWPVDRTLAVKAMLGGVGVLLAILLLGSGGALGIFYGVVVPPMLFFGPDLILRLRGKKRQAGIRVALPDTLDQVTVCVEAGLGFEAAMARAARTGNGPLAEELVRTLQDIQLGVPRKEAMRGLADRNGVEELGHFVQTIIQAEGYGVPIARVLRIHADELRDKRRQTAEERAMKVSIKLLFPVVVCILPTTFIVMVGPAIFQLLDTLASNRP